MTPAVSRLRWVESEGGPLLLVAGDDLGAWSGTDGDDYDALEPAGVRAVRIGRGRAISLGSPDPTALWPHEGAIVIVRQLGADSLAASLAGARLARRWRTLRLSLRVRRSGAVFLIDSALGGSELARRRRMPAGAAKIAVPPGDFVLETAGELAGTIRTGGRLLEYLIEVHRLRPRRGAR
jgi:hypothetical protein